MSTFEWGAIGAKVNKLLLRQCRAANISPEQYAEWIESREYKCGICQELPMTWRGSTLMFDHSHDTKKFRGLLCDSCNKALGLFKDSPARLFSAIRYLKGNKANGAQWVQT